MQRIGPKVLAVYRRYLAQKPQVQKPPAQQSTIAEVRSFEKRHHGKLHDLSDGSYPDLTDRELDEAYVFLRRKGGATWLILRAARWTTQFGGQANAMLEELEAERRLKAIEGYQWHTKVRKSKLKDRVYAVRID